MRAPVLATNIGTTLLWLLLILLLILLILYLVWLFTRRRRKERVGPVEAAVAPEALHAPAAEVAQPVAPAAEAPAEAVPVPEVPRAPVAEVPADDLTSLEGIGPKVAQVLASIGITTFKALAEADYDRVKQALVEAGWPYMDPAGWIEQAKLAAEGRWEELARLQEQLKGGRQR